jgi:hypothetical protein
MISTLHIPSSDDLFASLPSPVRDDIRHWVTAFRTVPLTKPIGRSLDQIARIVGTSPKTVRRKYDALRTGGDWRVFLDHRRITARESRTKDPGFQAFLKKLFEDHKRSSASAINDLYTLWRRRADIPGYEGHPGWPNLPDGWSERNLYRHQPTKPELIALRIGRTAAKSGFSQTFSTRVGLWVGSHIMFDDLWHDNFVRVGERGTVGRVMELDALDVFSGCKIAWGCKPRLPKKDNPAQMEGLKERNMRLLLAGLLFTRGYSPRGTVLMAEHGTAAIRDRAEQILADATRQPDGTSLITVKRSGITGEEQAILDGWRGSAKGNPAFKAPLESLRNLIHNRLDALPGQTGPDRDRRPEILDATLAYQQQLLDIAARLPAHRRDLLDHPLLEYHSEFLPFLGDFYGILNQRTDHRLQGWAELGFLSTDYRLAPSSDAWLTPRDLQTLPEDSRLLLHSLARQQPETYSRTRRLSPQEVFDLHTGDLIRIGPDIVCDLLLQDLGREEKVKGSYFRFTDSEIAPEELIYEARIICPGATREQELPSGEKYLVFVNPFFPDTLFVCNARQQFLGLARRVQRVCGLDEAALRRSWGRSAQRDADRLAPARLRHAADGDAHQRMLTTNAALANEATPATREEKQAARDTTNRLRAETGDIEDLLHEPAPVLVADPDEGDIDDLL